MDDPRLTVAEWLLDSGAGASARALLGDARGRRANSVRRRAEAVALAPGIYAMVALADGGGAVVPLRPAPGRSRADDPAVREACDRALAAARALLGPRLPALRFELEEWLALFGPSLGLPAFLAFVAHYAPSRAPRGAVLATGRLGEGGAVSAVGHVEAKLAAAAAERGVHCALLPRGQGGPGAIEVATTAEAIGHVFGERPLVPDAGVLRIDELVERARREPDPDRAIALLEAIDVDALPEADRARHALELGTAYRHAGRSADAERLHRGAGSALEQARRVIGAEAAERYDLERRATELDAFRLDEAIDALSGRLRVPFLNAHNEVRCRGMLAQALGMRGDFARAAAVRRENVPLQAASETLRAVLPGTHCYVALDSARAGDGATFEAELLRTFETTATGDDHQWRYDCAAAVRGLVALGRGDEALAWAEGRVPLLGYRAPSPLVELCRGRAPVAAHPEVSTLRALARALRRAGREHEVASLAARVPAPATVPAVDLRAWLGELVRIEASLAVPDGSALVGEARARLRALHPAASAFHADLFTASGAALEAALDRVWY